MAGATRGKGMGEKNKAGNTGTKVVCSDILGNREHQNRKILVGDKET